MKKIALGIIFLLVFAASSNAQDVHFSQYFTSPLTLNPAMTGLVPDDIRVAADYRSQWSSVSANPYVTGTISFDMAILKNKLPEGDAIGLGVLLLYDKSGTGALTNTTVGGSFAYHKGFGQEKQHHISFGAQAYYVGKTIDFAALTFEDQFDPSTGGTPYQTKENSTHNTLSYPDFNLGIMYSGKVTDHTTTFAGFSYYHLTQPVETFINDPSHQIHSRYTGYLGGYHDLNENIVLNATALYQTQAAATEIVFGAAVGFVLNPGHDLEYQKNTVFYLGSWYRTKDAFVPYVAIEWSKMRIGLSYDVNVSDFMPATAGQGAYELSILYFGRINRRERNPSYNWACPKFY